MTDDLNITIFRTLSITLLLCITGPKITLLPVLALIIAQVGTFNIYKNKLYLQAILYFTTPENYMTTTFWLIELP